MATRTPRGKGKTFAEEFGERLRSARERRGFTQEQLAEMVGITASRESEYESGRFAPQLEKAAKLAVALEVSLDALVGRDTAEATEDIRDPKLRASVRELEATANARYLDAASLAVEGFASLARHDEFESRRPRRRKP